MLETLAELQHAGIQPIAGGPAGPGLRARAGVQQGFAEQGGGGGLMQRGEVCVTRAEHRADALGSQFEHLHIRRPRRFGEPQGGVHAAAPWVQLAFAGGQLQAQLRQFAVEAVQAWDKPARQQAARAGQDKRRIGLTLLQLGAGAAQAIEQFGADIAQTNASICEFKATAFLAEQGYAKVFFQAAHLAADRAMSNVQFAGRLADAVQTGGCFKGAQGVKRWKVVAHL